MKELLAQYLNKLASYTTENGLKVEVVIKDVKTSYGRDRYLITPVAGSGEIWVESVTLITQSVLDQEPR